MVGERILKKDTEKDIDSFKKSDELGTNEVDSYLYVTMEECSNNIVNLF